MVLAILLVSVVAAAEGRSGQARALHRQGEALVHRHAYLEAADHFIAAYNLDPKPDYLLEIARTYRTADACAKAAHYYRAYLSVMHLPPDGAVGHELAEMDACAATQTSPPSPATEASPSQPTPPAQPPPPPQPIVVERAAPAPAPARASASHAAPIMLTVVGLALAGGGAAYGFAATDLSNERENLCPAPCTWSAQLTARANDLDSRGQRDELLAVVGISAGVVAVAGGIALFWADHQAERRVVVAPAPGGASLVIRF